MQSDITAPYPLMARFKRLVLPVLILLTVTLVFVMGFGTRTLLELTYLELAHHRIDIINTAMKRMDVGDWSGLRQTNDPIAFNQTREGALIKHILDEEAHELVLEKIKIYGRGGVILFSTVESEIGTLDPSPAFQKAYYNGKPSLIEKSAGDTGDVYEIYLPDGNKDAGERVVFELYEKTTQIDDLIFKATLPAILVPTAMILFLGVMLMRVFGAAQKDITKRTNLIRDFQNRLKRLVSSGAVDAMADAVGEGDIPLQKVETTVFFSDVRGFTAFSERREPSEVIAALNKALSIIIQCVADEGGDVDKLIGDAVLARFLGPDKEARAIRAAIASQKALATSGQPLDVGIGIYDGEVILGTIGPDSRMDYTMIGDTVNVAARLCSQAMATEIVTDERTAIISKTKGFQDMETITVKGRQESLGIRRMAVAKE